MKKEIRITPIRNGTSIDHLNPGAAYKILEVFDLRAFTVTAAMNVESRKMGKKDIIFIEGKELDKNELDKVALIGKGATINTIKNGQIVKKAQLPYPDQAIGILRCINPKCICNAEKIRTRFSVKKEPLEAKCKYCETVIEEGEISAAISK